MKEENGTSLQLVNNNICISNEDVVAVAIVRHEELLDERHKELTSELGKTAGDLKDLEVELDKLYKKQENDEAKPWIEEVKGTLKLLDVVGKVDVITSVTIVDNRRIMQLELRFAGYANVAKLKGKQLKTTSEMLAIKKAIEKSQNRVRELQKSIAAVVTEQRNVGKLERRAKAALAISSLQRTEEGRAILENIKSLGEEAVKRLPAS